MYSEKSRGIYLPVSEKKVKNNGGFPGGPVVKTLCFQCRRTQIQSLVDELRSHKLCSSAKKREREIKKKNPIFSHRE